MYRFIFCLTLIFCLGCNNYNNRNNQSISNDTVINSNNDTVSNKGLLIKKQMFSYINENKTNNFLPSEMFIKNKKFTFISLDKNDSIQFNFSEQITYNLKKYLRLIIKSDSTIYFDKYISYSNNQWYLIDTCVDELYEEYIFGIGKDRIDNHTFCLALNDGYSADYLFSWDLNSHDSLHVVLIEHNKYKWSHISHRSGNFCSMFYFNDNYAIIGLNLFKESYSEIYLLSPRNQSRSPENQKILNQKSLSSIVNL
jgi:hypothetical protein